MALSNVLNATSSIATTAKGLSNKLGAIVSDNTDNNEIRDRYLNGFVGESTSFTPSVFARMFDEPTYLTFKIEFVFDRYLSENASNYHSLNAYSFMPCPLLASDELFNNTSTSTDPFLTTTAGGTNGVPWMNDYVGSGSINPNEQVKFYSTEKYLTYALGERKRGALLRSFIKALHDIQVNYPYYFKSIDGLNNLSMIDTEKGMRLTDENNTITIKCMEGLDMKITQLMQLYRKVAWDDVYQRWILPDMMRFFKMNIYVSEMRLFHSRSIKPSTRTSGRVVNLAENMAMTSYDQMANTGSFLNTANSILNAANGLASNILGPNNAISKIAQGANGVTDTISEVKSALEGNMQLCNSAINDVMPTIKYECRMCEFVIDDTLAHLGFLSSSKEGLNTVEPEIKIRIGNVSEKMMFPLDAQSLNVSSNKYVFNKDNELFKDIDDHDLQVEGMWRNRQSLKVPSSYDITSFTKRMYRMNAAFGGSNELLQSSTSTSLPEKDESYDPFSPSKSTAVMSLFNGVMNAVMSHVNKGEKSEAIFGEYAKDVRGNLSYRPGTRHEFGATARSNDESHNRLRNTRVMNEGEDIVPSTATSTQTKINSLIDETSAVNVMEASAAIKDSLSYIENTDIISTATDPSLENSFRNQMSREVIEALASSTATDRNTLAVKRLASIILEENEIHKSTAVNISETEREAITSAFQRLN